MAEPTAIDGIPITLVDTPGLGVGADSDSLADLAVRRAMERWSDADLRVVVMDGSAEVPRELFRGASELIYGLDHRRTIMVVNKNDLPQRWEFADLPEARSWPTDALLTVSARRGDGINLLRRRIVGLLGLADWDDQVPALFGPRQREVIKFLLADRDLSGPRLADQIRRELIG